MPELPEVETIRRDLARLVPGKKIVRVHVGAPKMVREKAQAFGRRLKGQKIKAVQRRGKLLLFVLAEPDLYLLVHLKMTGQLIYRDKKRLVAGGHGWPLVASLPNKHTHVIISFMDGAKLYFNDLRKFGYMRLVDVEELGKVLRGYGIEPLARQFTPEILGKILRGRRARLKSVLMKQELIAGLGNIYADEACFGARLRPTRRAATVSRAEIKRLHGTIQDILRRAIRARGTTFGTYRDGKGGEGNFVRQLKVYGRGRQPCLVCGRKLVRMVVGGRGTVYCAKCQK